MIDRLIRATPGLSQTVVSGVIGIWTVDRNINLILLYGEWGG